MIDLFIVFQKWGFWEIMSKVNGHWLHSQYHQNVLAYVHLEQEVLS